MVLTGFKLKKNEGLTYKTSVHNALSKIALDTQLIDSVAEDFDFPLNREIKTRTVNLGFTIVEIPNSIDLYGQKYYIKTLKDILLLSHIADVYDSELIRRRIYHGNMVDVGYNGFMFAYGTTSNFIYPFSRDIETFTTFIAYLNHYMQDATAPMHISLKDQDIHIPFEESFNHYLSLHFDELSDKTMQLFFKRAEYDNLAFNNHIVMLIKRPAEMLSLRHKIVNSWREGNTKFEGIENFMYLAVLGTVTNTAFMIMKYEDLWRDLI